MNEDKKELSAEDLSQVSGGTDFDENDKCPNCGSRNISLIPYARLHLCEDCGFAYD